MKLKYLACTALAVAMSAGAAQASTTLNTGGSSLAAPTYIAEYQLWTSNHPSTLFDYEAVGSGGGQKAFLNNDITQFENVPAGTLTYGTIVGTQVDIGASDAFLAASQLTNPATGSYGTGTEGSAVDGPIIQIPTFGTPIAMTYNQNASAVAGDKLVLTDAQICGILSGEITDWHTLVPSIPAGTTINVVVRSDGSGTTFLTTQHLNAVCTSSNSTFPSYPVPVTKYFYNSGTSASNYVFNTLPANFVGESGSANVASQLVGTANSFGYLSPDYTSIAPNSASTTSLLVSHVVNGIDHIQYLPSVAATERGLTHAGPGSTNAAPPVGLANRMNPLNWVPTVPQTTQGYSIVGYTTIELSSCYANKTAGSAINAFLTDQYTYKTYQAIINNGGFAPLGNTSASPYVSAIQNTFLGNKTGFNLNIDNATTCASYAGR